MLDPLSNSLSAAIAISLACAQPGNAGKFTGTTETANMLNYKGTGPQPWPDANDNENATAYLSLQRALGRE